jgi:PhoH-like ATPase
MTTEIDLNSKRKTFIIDTSVLLYDKHSIHSLPGNDIVIPIVVLDELDRFKEKQGLLGENARYVNRYLDNLRSLGSLHDGVEIEDDQTIRVDIGTHKVPESLDSSLGDNKIIACALACKNSSPNRVTVITKDINFRVKCDSLGIYAEDYYRDRIVSDKSQMFSGVQEIELEDIDSDLIEEFYSNSYIEAQDLPYETFENEFVILKSGSKSALGVNYDGRIQPLSDKISKVIGIGPRNKEQKFALDLLTRDDVRIVTMTGIAGSGKTFLTLMAGIAGLQDRKFERIVITRSLQTVGKEIGFLPGDVDDKLSPWLSPILDNFRQTFKDVSYFEAMRQKGQIEVSPLAFIRGRTFNNTYLIVDEAQNSTIHELKTIITRMGENSKIVLLGDTDQIDTPYLDSLSNGLTIVIEKFKAEKIAGHITMIKGERSELATLASRLL